MILIAAVGVLGVLSVMGLSFATVMRLEAQAATRFSDAVRAEFAARAGIEDAIARLRVMARLGAERPIEEDGSVAGWYTWRGVRGGGGRKISFPAEARSPDKNRRGNASRDRTAFDASAYSDWVGGTYIDGGDNYSLRVEDAASKININAGDNLGVILDNLCRAIGPPLRPADQEALIPAWFSRAMMRFEIDALRTGSYENEYTVDDVPDSEDLFYRIGPDGRPLTKQYDATNVGMGPAIYGDGFAIAARRARNGPYLSIEEVKQALTYTERGERPNGVPDLVEEQMEIEAKFAALRPYITIDSWTDTTQIGYGKVEHFLANEDGNGQRLVDRNKTWNLRRNWNANESRWDGELAGCYLAITNGVGQGQIKRIARNTIDTLWLDNRVFKNSEVFFEDEERHLMPTPENSYMIIGRDFVDIEEQRLYQRQPLSFHRAPVNVNTATDKVLVAVLMGLQTTWGPSGYPMYVGDENVFKGVEGFYGGTQTSLCPAVMSLGRDYTYNSRLVFPYACPNRDCSSGCFFCNYGRGPADAEGLLNEAHLIAWEILKEREETPEEDRRAGDDGHGPFRGWDDIYFRVFRRFDLGAPEHARDWDPRAKGAFEKFVNLDYGVKPLSGKRGLARLAMANFNSNTNILKFQPNLEWINRWGANFTDLYLPFPQLLEEGLKDNQDRVIGGNIKLRVRPGELFDKTDLNVGTTEFTFDSGGVYEIESIGRVYEEQGLVASRRISALVKVYDVWRESTQRQFVRGRIMNAEGTPGSNAIEQARMAGQVAVDGYKVEFDMAGNPVESSEFPRRKALMTYPEAITPKGHMTSNDGRNASLNVGTSGVAPAGFDGQIMLATNNMAEAGTSDVTFYANFSGDIAAEYSREDPEPRPMVHSHKVQALDVWVDREEDGMWSPGSEGVGLLGIVDSMQVDVEPLMVERDGWTLREGEGPGGDLRPDGIFLGPTGNMSLDGSIEWDNTMRTNMNQSNTTVAMWFKPMWHHGTVMRSTLPLAYRPEQFSDRGSHVVMRKYDQGWYAHPGEFDGVQCTGATPIWNDGYKSYQWDGVFQEYNSSEVSSEYKRSVIGFVRSRFEHEFLNAAEYTGGTGLSNDLRLVKYGDWKNSYFEYHSTSGGHLDYRQLRRRFEVAMRTVSPDYANHPAPRGAAPFGGLGANVKYDGTWIPGFLYGETDLNGANDANAHYPFYHVVPFRWHYVGLTWIRGTLRGRPDTGFSNSFGRGGGAVWDRAVGHRPWVGEVNIGGHSNFGMPLESLIAFGFPYYRHNRLPGDDIGPWVPDPGMADEPTVDGHWHEIPAANVGIGSVTQIGVPANFSGTVMPVVPDHHPDRTSQDNLSLVSLRRPFIDTMRTWGRSPYNTVDFLKAKNIYPMVNGTEPLVIPSYMDSPDDMERRLRTWAFEQYSTYIHSGGNSGFGYAARFGLNRGKGTDDIEVQRMFSGTYATIDEYTIYNRSPNPLSDNPGEFGWEYDRRSVGRYYTATGGSTRPWFVSQSLFDSEMAQGYIFTHEEERESSEVEIGTVRWTAFTPYYCVHLPNDKRWTFPYATYFREVDGRMQEQGQHIDQSWRHPPNMWRHDKRMRISPQRGCRVQIAIDKAEGGSGILIPGQSTFFDDPDAWSPILDARADFPGQHFKAAPGEVRYRVTFQLSEEEERALGEDFATLVDSPVFDDITMTYLRRPKIIEWRE